MPAEIAEVFDALHSEVTWLHGRWICYRQLFAESEMRIELLNECAGTFFYFIQDVLFDEVQVTLSKLTDPAKTLGKYDNLSLEQLQGRVVTHGDSALAAKCQVHLDLLQVKSDVFRKRRHKALAHLDLKVALKADQLPGVSRQMIEAALDLVRNYMNLIEEHYTGSATGYEHFAMFNDGNALVANLKAGVRYEELVQKGEISLGDLQSSKWSSA